MDRLDKEIKILEEIKYQLSEISPAKYLAEIERLELNCRRFIDYLNIIAIATGVEWIDGEYPLEEVLQAIDKKQYIKPQIIHELELEAKAGSPLPCPDLFDINGNPCN